MEKNVKMGLDFYGPPKRLHKIFLGKFENLQMFQTAELHEIFFSDFLNHVPVQAERLQVLLDTGQGGEGYLGQSIIV